MMSRLVASGMSMLSSPAATWLSTLSFGAASKSGASMRSITLMIAPSTLDMASMSCSGEGGSSSGQSSNSANFSIKSKASGNICRVT